MYYVHVLDNNTNVTRVVVGPQTFTRKDHGKVVSGPEAMVTLPPRYYCRIANPVVRDAAGAPQYDRYGQVRVRHGDEEIRFTQEPFPLYPGEVLKERPQALTVVPVQEALRVRATRDFTDEAGVARVAGNEWLFKGPATYRPRIEETVVERVASLVVRDNEALRLRATRDCVDWQGTARVAGEEWLVRTAGAYLPDVHEKVVGRVPAAVLGPKTALHVVATDTHTDVFGRRHRAGDEWLVTVADCDTYIPDISETLRGVVEIQTLTNRQFCVVLNPYDAAKGRNRYGARELRKGECSFFLHPGEALEHGIQDVFVLAEGQALLMRATEPMTKDESPDGVAHSAGDRWMIYGPRDFIPDVKLEVLETREMIPLDENEGVYVRDMTTGKIRAEIGHSYMLKPNEELWAKPMSAEVEALLQQEASREKKQQGNGAGNRGGAGANGGAGAGRARDPTRVVSYHVPHGALVQVFDYEKRTSRAVFGPDVVLLKPDEQFTTLSLSGDVPKRENVLQTIAVFLGPDFMTDQIIVETTDHARLSLKLSYNWYFDVSPDDPEKALEIFSTPDFVGDLCKALGSRVRGAVAATTFERFHKQSVEIIQDSVFGRDKAGKLRDRLVFASNHLVVSNVDIQSVEPVDQKTRDSLQKSVQLAIEITSRSQEASARHEAERMEQEAKGALERQKLADEAAAERNRTQLLELQAQSVAVESAGQATAEARAAAEAAKIEGQAAVDRAKLEAESLRIAEKSRLEEDRARQAVELEHRKQCDALEIAKSRQLAEIEVAKFAQIVDAIGADTLCAIARAGPEMQSRLLSGLGLQSVMITDGSSPINLFNTASGLVSTTSSSSSSVEETPQQ